MIGDLILTGVNSVLEWIVGQLPAFTGLPAGLVTAFNFFASPVAGACSLVPGLCTALAFIVPTALGIAFIVAVFYSVSWIFHWRQ